MFSATLFISFLHRHPDKNKGEEAQANMVNINQAYEVCGVYSLVIFFKRVASFPKDF